MTDPLAQWTFSLAHVLNLVVVLVLAHIAWRQDPRPPHLRTWAFFCLLVAGYSASIIAAANLPHESHGITVVRLALTFGSAALLALLWFILDLTTSSPSSRWLKGVGLIWLVALEGLFWGGSTILAGVTPAVYARATPVMGSWAPIYLAFILYVWVVTLIVTLRFYRRSQGRHRTQAAYLLVAFGIACAGTTSALIPAQTGTRGILAAVPDLFLVLFSVVITYATVRHRLWDIRTVAHRTAVWILLSAGLLVPLYVLLRVGAPVLHWLGAVERAVLLTILFIVGYLYLRWAKPRLDHAFARRAYDLQAVVSELTERMVAAGDPREVIQRLVSTLRSTLYPEHLLVRYAPHGEAGPWRTYTHGRAKAGVPPIRTDSLLMAHLEQEHATAARDDFCVHQGPEDAHEDILAELDSHSAQVAVPLIHAGSLLGVIYLGPKRSLKPYSRGDIELLDRLGVEASIGLANALLYERVDHQRRELERLAATLEDQVAHRTRELQDANRRLQLANEELKELDRLKSRLFTDISHELRTPLTLILAPLDAMLREGLGDFTPQQQAHLDQIRRSSLELLKRVDDLLDLSRLEESGLKLRVTSCDLGAMLARIVDYARPLAKRKDLSLDLDISSTIQVEADTEKLERVVVNLLTNAFKFTPPGGQVTLRLSRRSPGRAVIEVADSGIGIATEEIEQIFSRFYRVQGHSGSRAGGFGIGLALSSEIVELHGGTIGVESTPGRGSTFRVEIPERADGIPAIRLATEQTESPAGAAAGGEGGLTEWSQEIQTSNEYRFLPLDLATERRITPRSPTELLHATRVLVVDDNVEILRYLHQILASRHEVWTAQDGDRAWSLLLEERHDVVIADVIMPGLDGLALCRRIKEDVRTRSIPVVMVTARSDVDGRIEGHRAGADAYLAKPFSATELLSLIDRLVREKVKRREVSAAQSTASMEYLLAGLAHELGNAAHQLRNAHSALISLVRSAAPADRLEVEQTSQKEQLARMEGVAQRALDRMGRVVASLHRFAHQQLKGAWTRVSFDELVAEQISLLGETSSALVVDLASGAEILGSEEDLRQLVLNLVDNALHATDGSGKVQVQTSVDSGMLRFTVRDDGCGILPENLDRVCDPFFTTRETGGGMGLGLTLCRKTASDMGGRMTITSHPGQGTEVIVNLPRAGSADGEDSTSGSHAFACDVGSSAFSKPEGP